MFATESSTLWWSFNNYFATERIAPDLLDPISFFSLPVFLLLVFSLSVFSFPVFSFPVFSFPVFPFPVFLPPVFFILVISLPVISLSGFFFQSFPLFRAEFFFLFCTLFHPTISYLNFDQLGYITF